MTQHIQRLAYRVEAPTPAARAVLDALASLANGKGEAAPTMDTLAELAGTIHRRYRGERDFRDGAPRAFGFRTVNRALADLVAAGLVVRERRFSPVRGNRRPDLLRLKLPGLAPVQEAANDG